MNALKLATASRLALLLGTGLLAFGLAWPLAGVAQDKPADASSHKHADKGPDQDKALLDQVRELQAKVAKLEAALKQGHPAGAGGIAGAGGMGGMSMGMGGPKTGAGMAGMGEMGTMMDMMMGGMGGKKPGMAGMSGMGGGMGMGMEEEGMDRMGMMGMESMGKGSMKGMGKVQRVSALPGFPGASHMYHIGATGFFLDHPEHIKLMTKQESALNHIQEKALMDQASSQRRIDEAEQELCGLTASDQPEAAKIEAKVREIEKLRTDKRLTFIRAVGEAAKNLTDEQRQTLLGVAGDPVDKPAAKSGQ
jgi:hypothetical protein